MCVASYASRTLYDELAGYDIVCLKKGDKYLPGTLIEFARSVSMRMSQIDENRSGAPRLSARVGFSASWYTRLTC